MALMTISDSNVKYHLEHKSSEIIEDMSDFKKCEALISPQNIIYVNPDSLVDKHGNYAMARFEYNCNTIKIDCHRIALKCQAMIQKERIFFTMQKSDVLLFSELILEHELAHVYQKQYLKRDMKPSDVCLEEEADNIAIEYFSSYHDMNDERIKTILSYYKDMHGQYIQTL